VWKNNNNSEKNKNSKTSPDKQHSHLVERDKPTKSELVGQTLPQLPWKQKKGDLKKLDSFHQTS
jgi:hypothetical protein